MEKRYCVKAGDDSDESDWLQGTFPTCLWKQLVDWRKEADRIIELIESHGLLDRLQVKMQIVQKKGEPIGFSIEKAIKVMPLTLLVTHMRLIILGSSFFRTRIFTYQSLLKN